MANAAYKQGRLLGIVTSLGLTRGEEGAQAELVVEEAVTTSAIEGEKLSPVSVGTSYAKLGLPSAGMPVDRDAKGYSERPL